MGARKKVAIGGIILAVLATIIGFSVNSRKGKATRVQAEKVERVERLVSKVSASGEIKPKEYVELQAEIAGVITDLYVKEGDLVQKGDLLLRIDPTQTRADARAQRALLQISLTEARTQEAQIALQKSNVERDAANVRLAEAELDRSRKAHQIAQDAFHRKQELYEQNLISKDLYQTARNDLLTAETAVRSAQARLDQARAQLKVARVVLEQARNAHANALSRIEQSRATLSRSEDLLSKTLIRSPLSGIITKLNVEKGERAVPGTLNNPSATLMEIADLSVIEAEIEVDETDIVSVKLGQKATVKVDALPDEPFSGHVTEIGNSAIVRPGQQQEAKDFKVVVQLEGPLEKLRPGLSCTAEITTATRQNVLTIPIQALTVREYPVDEAGRLIPPDPKRPKRKRTAAEREADRKRKRKEFQGVFLVDKGTVRFVEVKTGITGETQIEVLSGIQEGQEVVTGPYKALRNLKWGDRVKTEKS